MIALRNAGQETNLYIGGTPYWAQRNPSNPDDLWTCGEITSTKRVDFANFVYDVVQRYSQAPYYVYSYTFFNEPDISRLMISDHGSGARFQAVVTNGEVSSINIWDGGSGYTGAPWIYDVFIVGGGGHGAYYTISTSGGVITAMNKQNGGSGYTSLPGVYIAYNFVGGCWGDYTDSNPGGSDGFAGGTYYGDMAWQAGPKVHQANSNARVVVGNLMLNCNPTNFNCSGSQDPSQRFMKGILEPGRLNGYNYSYFDVMNFHAYDTFWGHTGPATEGQYETSVWGSYWDTSGPLVVTKTEWIKSVFTTYAVSGKQLWASEAALNFRTWSTGGGYNPPDNANCSAASLDNSYGDAPSYNPTKGVYAPEVVAASLAEGLERVWWFALVGWRANELVGNPGSGYTNPCAAWWALSIRPKIT